MKCLIIIPAYNEENSILQVVNEIKNSYDYVIINDASTDGTAEICEENNLNVINLSNNLGIGGAMQTGLKYALSNDYDFCVQFDGDGQHFANEIPKLIKKIVDEDDDLVIGSRYLDNEGFKSTYLRRQGTKFFSHLIKFLTGKRITDPTSGFRIINKRTIEVFAENYPTDYPEPESLVFLAKNECKIAEIGVKMQERKDSKSSITAFQSIYYMFKVTISCILATGDKI